ncbi:MAG: DUF4910 domain-containing protein [Symbiobacteriaceae bacterium]|nr:DUF4910 domain-containing protein [Symbiobacteriaceae bacterium]
MLKETLAAVQKSFSGDRAFHHVAEVSQHHRIQSSPGFRDAANYCNTFWQGVGVSSQVVSYPSDFGIKYWTQRMWEEWSCQEGVLELTAPTYQLLADYSIDKISLIQRSYGTPPQGVQAPLIMLDKGDEEEHYPEVDFTGAVVFTGGDLQSVRQWAVEKRGAIGIVIDRLAEFPPVRHRYDIPDAMQYTSFWWTGKEKPCFGFVLSPKRGDMLRAICQRQAAAHAADPEQAKYPQVLAKVTSQLYPGAIENVEAFIPGVSDEEILLEAHLCHPQASANDNASGVGVLLEAAHCLQKLIDNGTLPKPQRGIRFLLIPEMTGTYAWLSQNEGKIPQIKAGLNLDMVGEKQELCQGPLVVEYPPQASLSFVGDLAAAILDGVALEAKNLGGSSSYALFKHNTAPFSGGSDHYILSDPTVGIPSPMLIQWPDKFYHTSADTIDKVDPQMLYRVGCLTATYAWCLANIGSQDLPWLLSECRLRFLTQLGQVLQSSAYAAVYINREELPLHLAETHDQVRHLLFVRNEQIASMQAFLKESEQESFAKTLEREKGVLLQLAKALWQEHKESLACQEEAPPPAEETDANYLRVPKRTFRGPWSNRGWIETLPPEEQEAWRAFNRRYGRRGNSTILSYWIDGKRNIAKLSHLVAMETGSSDIAYCAEYLDWLAKLGLIAWV